MDPWRIVFMGTPEFAVASLSQLLAGPDPIVAVFTQPDKPTGRGMKMRPSPVKQAVLDRDIPLFQPKRLRDPQSVADLIQLKPDLIVVVAYGQILSEEVLLIPRYGCINVHASLLPRWRGAAPLHRALLAGDSHSGITLMTMEKGLDTGPILSMHSLPIHPNMTGGELHDQLAQLGGTQLRKLIPNLKKGLVQPQPQPSKGVTYATKLTLDDEIIHWNHPASHIHRQIHALNPWPAANTTLNNKRLKLLRCQLSDGSGIPGTILSHSKKGPEVACQSGSLILTQVQPAGKKPMDAAAWLRGFSLPVGTVLG